MAGIDRPIQEDLPGLPRVGADRAQSRVEFRGQLSVVLDEESKPGPDVAVRAGSPRDYLAGHPTRPVLYARARVLDYRIVNLVECVLEAYRDPTPPAGAPPRSPPSGASS